MTTREVFFYHTKDDPNARTPYIMNEEPINYIIYDGTEGSITFNGYYYVEDHAPPYPEDDLLERWDKPNRHSEWLPKKLMMFTKVRDTKPYKEEYNKEKGSTSIYYKFYEESHYLIEVYKREIHQKTDKYSETQDDDGEVMNICFFPTCKQTLYFKVLEKLT